MEKKTRKVELPRVPGPKIGVYSRNGDELETQRCLAAHIDLAILGSGRDVA
jgi:hypothetical protein